MMKICSRCTLLDGYREKEKEGKEKREEENRSEESPRSKSRWITEGRGKEKKRWVPQRVQEAELGW